ncbi:MAG: 6-phosphogluconolactonase [Nitrospira sp.]
MIPIPEVVIGEDGPEWLAQACRLFGELTSQAVRMRGRCIVALSGGSTPKALYHGLTAPEWRSSCPWDRITFLFGDERCVPPDHAESNFAVAKRALFEPLAIPAERIHRMKGETDDPAGAARDYERDLRRLTACPPPLVPRLDLVLLGIGEDGHTASLFPSTPTLHEYTQLVTVSQSPKGIATRLTLTLGVINRATVVLFLVSGPGKAPVVRSVLRPQTQADRALPAALVKPETGRLIWLLDRSAALQIREGESTGE